MTLRSPEIAEQRARFAMQAAELFLANSDAIEEKCNWAQEDEIVLAVVKRDLTFDGAIIAPLNELREQVAAVGDKGWTLVFSPGSTGKDIEARCNKMAELARARLDVIRRWRDNHPK